MLCRGTERGMSTEMRRRSGSQVLEMDSADRHVDDVFWSTPSPEDMRRGPRLWQYRRHPGDEPDGILKSVRSPLLDHFQRPRHSQNHSHTWPLKRTEAPLVRGHGYRPIRAKHVESKGYGSASRALSRR